MKIYDADAWKEMLAVEDREEYIFEYVSHGVCYQDVMVNYKGIQYARASRSEYQDSKTGAMLVHYVWFDEEDDMHVVVRNLDGTLESK